MSTEHKVKSVYGSVGFVVAVVVGLLLLLFASRVILRPTVRIPYDLPVHDLFETQLQALGPTWTKARSELHTDDLFTKAEWALYTKFDHEDYDYGASEELHTFANPMLARVWSFPSPRSVNVDKRGNPPPGWSYSPSYADEFALDCSQEDVPRFCYFSVRYQEYSIIYGTDVAGAMTLEDLQHLIQATDEFMHDYLSNTTLEEGSRQLPSQPHLDIEDGM